MIGQKNEAAPFVSEMEVGVIREGKVIVMVDVTNMEKFHELMTSEKSVAWNTKQMH